MEDEEREKAIQAWEKPEPANSVDFQKLFEELYRTLYESSDQIVAAIENLKLDPPEPMITATVNPPSCEWRRDRYSDDLYQTNCGKEFRGSSIWNYCPECGKVIFNV